MDMFNFSFVRFCAGVVLLLPVLANQAAAQTYPYWEEDGHELDAYAEDVIEDVFGEGDMFAGLDVNCGYGYMQNPGKSGIDANNGTLFLQVDGRLQGDRAMCAAVIIHEWIHIRDRWYNNMPFPTSVSSKMDDECVTQCSALEALLLHIANTPCETLIERFFNNCFDDPCKAVRQMIRDTEAAGRESTGNSDYSVEDCLWVPVGTTIEDFTDC
jgi:hypothetical protein